MIKRMNVTCVTCRVNFSPTLKFTKRSFDRKTFLFVEEMTLIEGYRRSCVRVNTQRTQRLVSQLSHETQKLCFSYYEART